METLIKLRKRINDLQDQMDTMQKASTDGLSSNDIVKLELAATKTRIRFEKAQGDYLVRLGDLARKQVEDEDAVGQYDPKAPLVPRPDWADSEVEATPEFKSRTSDALSILPDDEDSEDWKGDVSAKNMRRRSHEDRGTVKK